MHTQNQDPRTLEALLCPHLKMCFLWVPTKQDAERGRMAGKGEQLSWILSSRKEPHILRSSQLQDGELFQPSEVSATRLPSR